MFTEENDPGRLQLDDALGRLAEHWDCVQIFVSRSQPFADSPVASLDAGCGLISARIGQAHFWCTERLQAIQERLADGESPSEVYNSED